MIVQIAASRRQTSRSLSGLAAAPAPLLSDIGHAQFSLLLATVTPACYTYGDGESHLHCGVASGVLVVTFVNDWSSTAPINLANWLERPTLPSAARHGQTTGTRFQCLRLWHPSTIRPSQRAAGSAWRPKCNIGVAWSSAESLSCLAIAFESTIWSFRSTRPSVNRAQKWGLYTEPHEPHERALLKRWLPKDLPIVEFGGGIGVVSCSANRRLDRPEQHIVIEANPAVTPLLEQNRDLNGCRFQVKNMALGI